MTHFSKKLFLLGLLSFCLHAGIREYKPQDLTAVCQIMKNHWNKLSTMPEYNQALMDGMLIDRIPFDMAHKDKKLHIIVFEDEGKVVGFATYYYQNPVTGHVELLAIAPSHQSKGLGKKMMDYIQNELMRNKTQFIQLYVYPSNHKAIEFYKHLGFGVKLRAIQHWLLSKMLN